MSTRWMLVQYVGDMLRLPIASEYEMDKPFGNETLERDVKRIVVNPFSGSPTVFVPEADNLKLQEYITKLEQANIVLDSDNCDLRNDMRDMQFFINENVKLRELVIAQCECVKHDDCNECVHYSEGKCMFPFKSMYCELGVEADG